MQQSIQCTKRFPVRAEPSPPPTVLTNIPKLLCFVLTKTIIRDQEGRSQVNKMLCRHLEIRPVILSAAKDLFGRLARSFAALRACPRAKRRDDSQAPLQSAHRKPSLQMSSLSQRKSVGNVFPPGNAACHSTCFERRISFNLG